MNNDKQEVKLLPKGVYCCPRCNNEFEVFVRVVEVACNLHGQMTPKGEK